MCTYTHTHTYTASVLKETRRVVKKIKIKTFVVCTRVVKDNRTPPRLFLMITGLNRTRIKSDGLRAPPLPPPPNWLHTRSAATGLRCTRARPPRHRHPVLGALRVITVTVVPHHEYYCLLIYIYIFYPIFGYIRMHVCVCV